jgi:hypothetical protein
MTPAGVRRSVLGTPGREEWEAGDSATRPGLSPSASTALLVVFRPIWARSISRKSRKVVLVPDRPPSSAFSGRVSRPAVFSAWISGSLKGLRQRGRSMSTHTPTGSNWPEAVQQLEARRQARVVASFAEYLAEDVHRHPDRALEAMASLAEWCDGDPELLAQARADVLRDTRGAQMAVAENNHEAVELLELAGRAS